MPFVLLWLTFDILALRRPERNGFKTNENSLKLSAVKNVHFIPDIPTELVKKRAKELSSSSSSSSSSDARITFNDVLMTAISKSLHDYLREKTEDRRTQQAILACPFSLRRAPEQLLDFEYNNDFAIIPLKLRLVDSLAGGVRLIS